MARPEQGQNLIQMNQYLRKKTQVNIVPRNLSQETYLELLKNPRKLDTIMRISAENSVDGRVN